MSLNADLGRYGLNAYENAAYVTLVRQGICTAHVLSKESGVPYGKIYPVLASLQQKGFVEVFEGPPKKFVAVEPKIIIEKVVRKKEEECKRFKQQSAKVIRTLGEFSARKQEPLESIRIIDGFKKYLDLSVALHNVAKEEWCSITDLSVYKEHFDATAHCIKRGVSVKLLTFPDELEKQRIKLWKDIGAEIRITEFTPTQFSIIDGKEGTVRITGEEKYIALWLRNKSFAQNVKKYFTILWKKARKV